MAKNPEFEAKVNRKPNGEFDTKNDKKKPLTVSDTNGGNRKLWSREQWEAENDGNFYRKPDINEFTPDKINPDRGSGCSRCGTLGRTPGSVYNLAGQDCDLCPECCRKLGVMAYYGGGTFDDSPEARKLRGQSPFTEADWGDSNTSGIVDEDVFKKELLTASGADHDDNDKLFNRIQDDHVSSERLMNIALRGRHMEHRRTVLHSGLVGADLIYHMASEDRSMNVRADAEKTLNAIEENRLQLEPDLDEIRCGVADDDTILQAVCSNWEPAVCAGLESGKADMAAKHLSHHTSPEIRIAAINTGALTSRRLHDLTQDKDPEVVDAAEDMLRQRK